mgnify:CR=1 FL=1|tara:strand:- start:1006 stop:1239 length:234 start_codon:yes stop_codon:yes gene_type:complete
MVDQFVKVRKLKSLSTQVPKVSKPNPAINIINAATLYLVDSDPLLSKNVSSAKEFVARMVFCGDFFLDENILIIHIY